MSSSSSGSIGDAVLNYYPLINPKVKKEEAEKDWVKIGMIIAAVIGGLIAALAILCFMQIFPTDLLGGELGAGITLIAGAAILLPAAYVLFDQWQNKKNDTKN